MSVDSTDDLLSDLVWVFAPGEIEGTFQHDAEVLFLNR
jgi:hypothetical protein